MFDHVTRYIFLDFFFQGFFKFSLLYHLSNLLDVFNNGIWKICQQITNDLEPGLNLLEYFLALLAFVLCKT